MPHVTAPRKDLWARRDGIHVAWIYVTSYDFWIDLLAVVPFFIQASLPPCLPGRSFPNAKEQDKEKGASIPSDEHRPRHQRTGEKRSLPYQNMLEKHSQNTWKNLESGLPPPA